MTAQFAGSRSLDDRRRRRLAQESGEETAPSKPSKRVESPPRSKKTETADQPPIATDVVAEESLIPSRLWKVAAYGIVGVLFWSGLIWINLKELTIDGLERLLSPTEGNAFRFFSTISLMLASQLSFTIWWYRSRSRKDFGGRYRIWAWAGSFWAVTCIAVGLGLHAPLAKLIYEQWPIHSWRPELFYWFVPFSIGVLALHQLVSLDMRHSRASRFLWNTTLTCGACAAGLMIGLDLSLPDSTRDLAISGSACLWHFLLSFTLLFHARFVVHVTNEAAPRKASRLARLKLTLLERTARIRVKLPTINSTGKDKRAESRKLKKAAKAKRLEEKELARMEKQESIAQKKAERIAAQEAKLAEKQQKAAQKVANAQEKKTEKDRIQKEAIAKKQTVEKKGTKSSQSDKQKPQTAPPTKTSRQTPEAKTASGNKRKRVLGNNTRVDAPQEAKAPHSEQRSKSKKRPAKNSRQSFDDDYEDDDFNRMSKKERRRARKKQRQRDN